MSDASTNHGLLVVLSGPSGVGKTTIVRALESRLGAVFSVSATTRSRADIESHGRDYLFIDESRFQRMVDDGEFLEHAQVFGRHRYGTPRAPVEASLAQGHLVVLDIDVQGALQVKQARPDTMMIFILPPSDEELLRRLQDRQRDSADAIQRRFSRAKAEMHDARQSGQYDLMLVNDDLATAIDRVCSAVAARIGGD